MLYDNADKKTIWYLICVGNTKKIITIFFLYIYILFLKFYLSSASEIPFSLSGSSFLVEKPHFFLIFSGLLTFSLEELDKQYFPLIFNML